ncbi:CobW family GTP-binding protein [Gluconacetobacter sp. Hr-1-5]|uniref:CobW family GTP-binding protein n=1 Tax=Gluconacetobacter sp. Hr-1-5 TaxID=3395370 RepID=UPI003B52ACC7
MTHSLFPPSAFPAPAPVGRIPVTLLTGFLGAGKTTFLNWLTRCPTMVGAAVLINEFGEVGLDHHLVDFVDESLVILESGCLCCTMRGDLVAALKGLHGRLSRRELPALTRIVIETTGLADPVPVINTLMEDRFVAARFVCDGILTVVDATRALDQIARHTEARRQVAVADRLLISKTDLADRATGLALERRLKDMNPAATILDLDTIRRSGTGDPACLFGALDGLADKGANLARWLGEEGAQRASDDRHNGPPRQGRDLSGHHDNAVRSFVVRFDDPVPWYGFAVTMGLILQTYGARLLRMKGLMNSIADIRPVIVQGVQAVAYPLARLSGWPAGNFADQRGCLVFICDGLHETEEAEIRAALSNLPTDSAALRMAAATPLLPTRCWLKDRLPMTLDGLPRHDAFVIQAPPFSLGRRRSA